MGGVFISGKTKEKEKETFLGQLNAIYRGMSTKLAWGFWAAVTVFGICCDLIQRSHRNEVIEELFSGVGGDLIAIILVIWTFTVSLSVYVLEKAQERYYGIKIEDLLIRDLKRGKLWGLAALILLELLLLILATVGSWKISLVISAFLQFYTMIYFFLLVCLKVSEANVLKQIGKEVAEIEELSGLQGLLLRNMIRKLQYEDEEQCDELLGILKDSVLGALQRMPREDPEVRNRMIGFCGELAREIVECGKRTETVLLILRNWCMNGGFPEEAGLGVVDALVRDVCPWNLEIFEGLLAVERKHQRAMRIRAIVGNLYAQQFDGEGWRRMIAGKLKAGLDLRREQNLHLAVEYWDQLDEERGKGKAVLLHFIFGEGGDPF